MEESAEFSPQGPIFRRRSVRWLTLFSCFTLIGLFFCGQNILRYVTAGQPVQWDRAVAIEMLYWYIWALLTPPILQIAHRWRIERRSWLRSLVIHFAFAVVIAPSQEFLWRLLVYTTFIDPRPLPKVFEDWPTWRGSLLVGSLTSFYKYWLIVAVYYLFDYYRKFRHREQRALDLELKTSQLKRQLSNARLEALKMQLHPHFLFNTLNAISVLIRSGEASTANQMVVHLSDFLRTTLSNADTQMVTVEREIGFLEQYLEIERIRFHDRLTLEWQIAPETLDVKVPFLILQPIVENAVQHGIASNLTSRLISVRADRVEETLRLEVCDDGPGLPDAAVEEGVGLQNTRARLQQLYGGFARLELGESDIGGARTTLWIPVDEKAEGFAK